MTNERTISANVERCHAATVDAPDTVHRPKRVSARLGDPPEMLGKPLSVEIQARRVERVMGIEPTFLAWEANVLPLNYTRMGELEFYRIATVSQRRSQGMGRGSRSSSMGARPQGLGGLIGGLPEVADPPPFAEWRRSGAMSASRATLLPIRGRAAGGSLPPGRSAPGGAGVEISCYTESVSSCRSL